MSNKSLTVEQLSAIHEGLKNAGLADHKLVSLHLTPRKSIAMETGEGPCHSVPLPNGGWVIVCS